MSAREILESPVRGSRVTLYVNCLTFEFLLEPLLLFPCFLLTLSPHQIVITYFFEPSGFAHTYRAFLVPPPPLLLTKTLPLKIELMHTKVNRKTVFVLTLTTFH